MGDIFCMIGTLFFVVSLILTFATETERGTMKIKKDRKSIKNFMDVSTIILASAGISVVCFIAFGVSLYIMGYM